MTRSTESAPRSRRLRRLGFRASAVAVALLSTYLIAELVLAPILHERFGLFRAAYFVNDIDHRMPPHHPALPKRIGVSVRKRFNRR